MTYILWLSLWFHFVGGQYFEYACSVSSKHIDVRGVTRVFVSPAGKSRVEFETARRRGARNIPSTVTLGDINEPGQSYSLFDDTKTYVVHRIAGPSVPGTATVTLIGRERVDGYDCVHARVITTRLQGDARRIDTLDIWKSTSVAVPVAAQAWVDRFGSGADSYTPAVATQLDAVGCTGFLVALEQHTSSARTRQDLVKATTRDMPEALFSVPAGYTERRVDY
jgi:hypothetical protein